jgi:predicted porin
VKRIQPDRSLPAKGARQLSVMLVAAAMPFAPLAARADETSDLKAQVKALTERLNRLEATQGQQAGTPPADASAAAPVAPKKLAQMEPPPPPKPTAPTEAASQDPLLYDQNGNYIGALRNPVMLYSDTKTRMTLYGIIEATISRVDHQHSATGGGSTTESGFQVAWFSGNRLGFDVDHALAFGDDIGLPNLKVMAKLETEYELPTGGSDTNGVLFNRDAWLGFYSRDLGKLTFGRQNTLTRDFTQNWGDAYGTPEVTYREGGYSNVNNFKQLIYYSAAATGTRVNSGIEWKKKWGDHWLTGLGWAFGSQGNGGSADPGAGGTVPGNFRQGTNQAVSVAWNSQPLGPGKLSVNANYDQDTRGPAAGPDLKHRAELFGGNYVFGPYRVDAGWIHYTAEQGPGNSAGTRTDRSWTLNGSARVAKTVFSLGYQRMGGDHAGYSGAACDTNTGGGCGVILNPMLGNTAGVTAVSASGSKSTLYGAVMYQPDRALDLYFAADRMNVNGTWIINDAMGNGTHIGFGQPHNDELELAIGARLKF